MIKKLIVPCLFMVAVGIGIAQQTAAPIATPKPEDAPKKSPTLPDSAKPGTEIGRLAFMAGRWIAINPNKTVNEEHWMTPKGNHMLGTFRQIRRDGKPGLIEMTLITQEDRHIKLKLRHLHGGLEIPKGREETDEFVMKSWQKNRVEFAGVGKSAAVTSVVYRLLDKNRMVQEVGFAPDSKETGYFTVYYRE